MPVDIVWMLHGMIYVYFFGRARMLLFSSLFRDEGFRIPFSGTASGRIYEYMCIHIDAYEHVCTYIFHIHVYIYIHTYIHVCVWVYEYVCNIHAKCK